MRILQLVSGTGVNGAVTHCLEVCRELRERGHDVTIACRPGTWPHQQALGAGYDVVESSLYPFSPGEVRRMARLLRGRRVDVMHTHMSRASFFGVVLRAITSTPSVATAHCRHWQGHWLLNDHVIAPSEASRAFQQRYNRVRASKLSIVPYFIDCRRFAAKNAATSQAARDRLRIAADACVLGVVGNVEPRKGLMHLVAALPQLISRHPRLQVVAVGKVHKEYGRQVVALAEKLRVADRLMLAKARSDVAQLLPAFDAFVLPSLEETFGIAISEALAVGLPVIATRVGGVPECVRHEHEGLLVPANDSPALAGAIDRMLSDPALAARLADNGRRRVRDEFSADAVLPRLLAVYQQVAERRTRAAGYFTKSSGRWSEISRNTSCSGCE